VRVYLSVPIIANRALERARLMAKTISEAGHEISSPWVLRDAETRPGSSVNIFARDKAAVEASDAIVADVSMPSVGVGMEVMIAYAAGERIILASAAGSVITRMFRDMDRAEWVRFADDDTLRSGLREALLRRAPATSSTASRT